MFESHTEADKEKKIAELLSAGIGNNEIMRRLEVSNYLIYKVKTLLGMEWKRNGRRNEVHTAISKEQLDHFVCPGSCGACPRFGQSPCPFSVPVFSCETGVIEDW